MHFFFFYSGSPSELDVDFDLNIEHTLAIEEEFDLNIEYLLGIESVANMNIEHLFEGAGEKLLVGQIRANVRFNFIKDESGFIFNDFGHIDYSLPYKSTSYNYAHRKNDLEEVQSGNATEIYYTDRLINIAGTVSHNLDDLKFQRLGTHTQLDFAACGNIKGVILINRSTTDLYIRLPYYNTSDYVRIPPKGEVLLSNKNGWTIFDTDTIDVMGDGTTQYYAIGLVG